MPRKTPKLLLQAIEAHHNLVDHTDDLIRAKTTLPLENQAEHVKEGTIDRWIGRVEGSANLLEFMLHRANCYAGFCYVGLPQRQPIEGTMPVQYSTARYGVGLDHPEFAEWRRMYYTRT